MQVTANSTFSRQASQSAYWPLKANRASKTSLKTQLQNLAQTLIHQLAGSSEPLVWSTQDDSGQTFWSAQDIASDRIIRHASETELRIWLEERHTF